MKRQNIVAIRRSGGTEGNSSKGQNFGNASVDDPMKIELPSGAIVTTKTLIRSSPLLTYGVEWLEVKNATLEDVLFLIEHRFSVHTNYCVVDGDIYKENGKEWLMPDKSGTPRFNGEVAGHEYADANEPKTASKQIAAIFGGTKPQIEDYWAGYWTRKYKS